MRLRALLALFAATALLVSGCGGSPEPKPLPKPSGSSTSSSPSPPVMPAAAKEKSKRGAIAFARYYVALVNHAQATGDVTELAAIEAEHAPSCEHSRKAVRQIYAAGGVIEGGDWTVTSATAIENPRIHGWLVSLAVEFGPQSVTRSRGAEEQHLKGGQLPVNLQVAREGPAWRVRQCTRGA